MLKIRSTPSDGKLKAQQQNGQQKQNSQADSSLSGLALPLPSLDLPDSENFSENSEESSQFAEPLCTNGTTLGTPDAPFAPGTRKSTIENFGKPAKKYSGQLYL